MIVSRRQLLVQPTTAVILLDYTNIFSLEMVLSENVCAIFFLFSFLLVKVSPIALPGKFGQQLNPTERTKANSQQIQMVDNAQKVKF